MDAKHSQVESAMSGAGDIAIVGFSFKLPQGVDDDDGFWDMLENKRNMKTGWPEPRINIDSFLNNKHHKFEGRGAHFIKDDVTVFDAPFFSVTAKEAASMDPMQRWTLEASYHAFEHAGIPAESLRGTRTAVFSASMEEDYTRMVSMDPDNAERTAVTGSTVASIIPNRVSWYFDMHGPSVHVNTACSSALAAFDLAYKTIQCGDASCALVTGCNLLLDPAIFQLLSDQNFLSKDGVCHSFDHRANGYARGEGIMAVVLKPVTDAVRDGDMIRAVIRGAGSNQDGQTPVMTQPSQKAQEDLIRHVYKQAKIPMDQTRYVEAHGTGTPTGDPIEMRAIGQAFRDFRSTEEPLYVGAIKANIGHLEGASALAGIIKSILILEKGIITPNPLFEKINSGIDVEYNRTLVPTQPTPWPGVGLRRISVNSFGFGGSNTHVIMDDAFHYLQEHGLVGNHCTVGTPGAALEGAAVAANGHTNGQTNGHTNGHASGHANGTSNGSTASLPKLLVWSAADEKALHRTTQGYDGFFKKKVSGNPAKLDRLAYTLATRRSQMLWRTFAIVMDGPAAKTLSTVKPIRSSGQAGLAYVFTGQGAQYVDMGWDLIQYPVFAETLRQIDSIYSSLGCAWSIFDELRNSEDINKPQYSQPLSTAVQIGLVELLNSFGVAPKAVVGHSSGEIAAAYAIGALSLQSACKVSYYRGQLAGNLKDANTASPGAMMSINLAEDKVAGYLKDIKEADVSDSVCVACINSPLNCTLSGLESAIDVVKAQADKDGIFAAKLKTGVGYHSASMMAIADEYRSLMGALDGADGQDIKAAVRIPMISSVSGKAIKHQSTLATAQYWVDNMVSPVRFSDALQLLAQEVSPLTDLVEVGSHAALKRPVLDSISQGAASRKQIRYTNTLHRAQPPIQAILDLAGQLFGLGHAISVTAVNQQKTDGSSPTPFLVDCPKYPFNHSQKYWAESRMSRDFRLRENIKGETLGVRSSDWNPLEPRWRRFLCLETDPWIGDHRISGTALFPGAGMLVMAIEAVQQMVPDNRDVAGFLFKKAEFVSPIIVKDTWDERTEVEIHLRPQKGRQSEKEDPTWFDATIFSYTEERWSECFRATIQVEYQAQADESEERRLVEEGIRSRHKQATASCIQPIDSVVLYRESHKQGLQFGDSFQVAQDVHYDGQANAVGRVDVTKTRYQTKSLVHPIVVDTAFMMLRVSAGQQPAANVPIRLEDAWFAAAGWQQPKTNSLRWWATSTSALSGARAAGYGEQGTLTALADDGTVLCSIGKAMTAAVSVTKDSERKLLYGVEWKPQLSLLEPKQLSAICHADYSPQDETIAVKDQSNMCLVFDMIAARTLKHLDRAKVPDNQRRHLDWMEYQVAKLSPEQRQEGESLSLEDVDSRLSEVEAALPSWKLYTACARRLPEIMAGDLDPLSVVYNGELANIFYADLFEHLCADSRLDTLLNLAAHENPAMRVLEVGAGTGGMTGHVLKKLQEREARTGAPSFAEYSYTDISPMFFERASGRWPQLQGRMRFKTLDLDQDIKSQGFEPASYDLVIAASVLHATPYLEPNIRNVRKALKPGGRLVLLEIVNPEDTRTNFMAGLVPGFWVAREEWRPHSPAVSEQVWDKLLKANGFSGNDVIMRDYQSDKCHITSILISTAVEEEKPAVEISEPSSQLILITDGKPSDGQQQLAKAVQDQINSKGERQATTCGFAQDELSKSLENLSKDDIVVCLAEVNNRPLLANLSEEEYAALKYLIGQAPNLFWVTATSTQDEKYASYSVVQGFLRSIRAEQPDNHIVTLAVEGETDESVASYISKIFQVTFDPQSPSELEYIVRNGTIITGRAIEDVTGNDALRSLLSQQPKETSWAESPALQLTTGAQNSLDALQFEEDTAYGTELAPRQVEIEAKAWGVSERDVQTASGRADNHRKLLGTDCAGVVTRVGSGELSLQPGDRVAMVALGCLRKYPRALETSVIKLPDSLPFDVAASVLAPGITAYRALVDIARLEEGEKVLIHAAASSVGQLAIQIAKTKGADIFATTSSSEEKQFLVDTLGINADHVFSSRNTSFAKAVLRLTEGEGVDVVLNSLTGSDELQASCECTARFGRFVEIGRANIEANAALPMAMFARNITFSAVDAVDLTPKVTARLLKETMQLLDQSKIQHPQPLRVFNASDIKEAFKQLQSGGDSGRVVVTPKLDDVVPQFVQERRSWTFDANASYLIAGGSGGLGRAIIRWMTDRGAKNIIVPSRSGASSKAAREVLEELAARGVTAIAPKCDVSSESSLASMLEECAKTMPPIKGCINAATVLQDAIFQQSMTFAQWDLTVNSKVQTSVNLHRQLPDNLDFFILLSSLAGVNGQMASSNYAGGCSAQDALASFRAANGQKALSLNIGWMRNIGLIAETSQYQRQRQEANDMQQIDDTELLGFLTIACDPTSSPLGKKTQALIGARTPAHALAEGQTPAALLDRPLWAAFSFLVGAGSGAGGDGSSSQQLAPDQAAGSLFRQAKDAEERTQVVLRALAAKLARAMSISPEDVESSKPLSSYGVDSLMAVELRNWIGREFSAPVPIFKIMGGTPIVDIADVIVAKSSVGKDAE